MGGEPGVKLNWDATLVNKLLGSRITTPFIVMDVLRIANLVSGTKQVVKAKASMYFYHTWNPGTGPSGGVRPRPHLHRSPSSLRLMS